MRNATLWYPNDAHWERIGNGVGGWRGHGGNVWEWGRGLMERSVVFAKLVLWQKRGSVRWSPLGFGGWPGRWGAIGVAAMGDAVLFEDIFSITRLDPDGKKFDKVSRIVAHSEQFDMDVLLDVNIDVYPVHAGEKFTLALASTLSLDGTLDDGTFDQRRRKSLADKYEYVMYGKVYKYADLDSKGPAKVESYVSFGGLLMCLKGDPNHLNSLSLDQRVYLLMRKV